MEFVHLCHFCGWRRRAESAVIVEPGCPACGCALDGVRRDDVARPESGSLTPAAGLRRPLATAALLFALGTLVAATRFGLAHGGGAGAVIGAGIAGFVLLPFLPARYAPSRSRS